MISVTEYDGMKMHHSLYPGIYIYTSIWIDWTLMNDSEY